MKTLHELLHPGIQWSDKLIGLPSLGIPRSLMPQVPTKTYPKFISYLLSRGIPIQKLEQFNVGDVHMTQKDIDLIKVRHLIDEMDGLSSGDFEDHEYLISSDNHLLDGHHRFLATVYSGLVYTVPVIRIGVPIRTLIPLAHDFVKELPPITEGRTLKELTEEERIQYKQMRKSFREMTYYQKLSRNPKTPYAKKKFLECYRRWTDGVRGSRKAFGIERARFVIDLAMSSALRTK